MRTAARFLFSVFSGRPAALDQTTARILPNVRPHASSFHEQMGVDAVLTCCRPAAPRQ